MERLLALIFDMKNKKGTTLLEVTVALLIAAITSMAVFSISTSSTVSLIKSDKKELAAMAIKMAQERLKFYVTADTATWTGPNNWALQYDTSTLNSWALANGTHSIGQWLNGNDGKCNSYTNSFVNLCRDSSGNCSCVFNYTVSLGNNGSGCGFGGGSFDCKKVVFDLRYPD